MGFRDFIIKNNQFFFSCLHNTIGLWKFIVDNFKNSELNHDEILWMIARQPGIMS